MAASDPGGGLGGANAIEQASQECGSVAVLAPH